jgi:hypothetical protein
VLEGSADAFVYDLLFNAVFTAMHGIEKIVTRYLFEINRKPSMGMSFFDSVLPWFRGVGVSKRRTQAGTLVLRLMGRCVGLKRPCTGPCLEGRAKKDISMLFSPVSFLGDLSNMRAMHHVVPGGSEARLST